MLRASTITCLLLRAPLALALLLAVGPIAAAEQEEVDDPQIEQWVEQLRSPQYLRREIASQRLIDAGEVAVPLLEEAARRGDLELTERSVQILRRLAVQEQPQQPGRAWEALVRVGQGAQASAATRARAAQGAIRVDRTRRARSELKEAGITVGLTDLVFQAVSLNAEAVRVPGDWDGPAESLSYLGWLHGIQYALVEGPATDREVLEQLVGMPDLRNVIIRDAPLSADDLALLKRLPRIDALELHFVPISASPEALDVLAELPIQRSLMLTDTELTQEQVDALRERMPGLKIEASRGGFLGVTCSSLAARCEINSVLPDSAAAQAGLQPRDVIIRFGDQRVGPFEELQRAIRMHRPGDPVELEFERGLDRITVPVQLGRMK